MAVWSETILARLLAAVELHYTTGVLLDLDRAGAEGVRLETAEAIAHAAAPSGIYLPDNDVQLAAVLARDAERTTLQTRGAIARLTDGRLAITAGWGRTIESAGESLALIESPRTDRYPDVWAIPGVTYLGRTT